MAKERTKLYIRFPTRLNEELEVKNLCPFIESVHMPRQKTARWCIVDFKTVNQRKKAEEIFKTVVIEGKRLFVKPWKNKTKPAKPKKTKKSDSVDTVQELLNS